MVEAHLRPIGFSSGALAKGDYKRGIALQREYPTLTALEISALREPELEPLVEAAATIDVDQFAYISFHAPSAFSSLSEDDVVAHLERLPEGWPVVVHPDLIHNALVWQRLGSRLCLENMDLRKRTGRTVDEMRAAFDLLPDAGFCLDLGHARQVDPTMGLAIEMLREFGNRLRQLHVSEVGTFGEHRRISYLARGAFARVVSFLPSDVPVILESIVTSSEMQAEVDTARELFVA
jgi:hypothetical protein